MPYRVIQPPPGRRRSRRRRARRRGAAVLVLVLLAVAAVVAARGRDVADPPARADVELPPSGALLDAGTAPLAGGGTAPSPLSVQVEGTTDLVRLRFRTPPRSGLLFDMDTGRVLWRHDPTRVLPIASLTKMMTALLVAERFPRAGRARITREALAYQGSGVGLLPRGRWIRVGTLLHGLLLPSGNDAAIALAQRTAGTVADFVALMNRRAQAMGLVCTRFSSPSGFVDRGNHSCATDLAALARAVLRDPRLAPIVRRREAVLPFPIKGGKLYLYNNNPLLRMGYRGTTGVKTGYTDAAGRCIVATARRGPVHLGVVLLDSPDTGTQARRLLDRGFDATRTAG
jgi:D-alanyl-D-alanine carboxypeptidase (penicillin-binding protein 5/6)